MELVSNKWISQYINIDGMERLFSETYIEFEWEMHLSADYKKHNMKFYRDHFFHQVKDTYMMYMLLKNHGFYEYARNILMNESESKVWTTDKPTKVYRALQDYLTPEQTEVLSHVGGVFKDASYVSTTTNLDTARRFKGSNPILEIELPEKTKYLDLDTLFNIDRKHWSEQEFLLPKNSKFAVTGLDEQNNIIKVKLLT